MSKKQKASNVIYFRTKDGLVTLDPETGTKKRIAHKEEDGGSIYNLPESIDLKITNYCDMAQVCTYCHESSNKKGKDASLGFLNDLLSAQISLEIAIGGGNPLDFKYLDRIIYKMYLRSITPNITINQLHLKSYKNTIEVLLEKGYIKGIGVSFRTENLKYFRQSSLPDYRHTVWHFIAGVHRVDQLDWLLKEFPDSKVLILGYKTFGNGERHYIKKGDSIDRNLEQWRQQIRRFMETTNVLSFDNLAIEQLGIQRFFTQTSWSEFYMGDDGTHSMYIDAVNQVAKPNSYSKYSIPLTLGDENTLVRDTLSKTFELIKKQQKQTKLLTSL